MEIKLEGNSAFFIFLLNSYNFKYLKFLLIYGFIQVKDIKMSNLDK